MITSYFIAGGLVLSLISAAVLGRGENLMQSILTGAQQGVQFVLSIAGALCLWSGVNRLMDALGVQRRLASWLRPLWQRLFPGCTDAAYGAISANVSANLLGLGNAATPLGIEAARRMARGQESSDALCRFVVLNTASVQLLPTTVAALRAAEGAAQPFDLLPCVWMTSAAALLAGMSAAVLLGRVWSARGW